MIKFLKKILPRWLKNIITSLFYGWHGNYKSWKDAKIKCSGYNNRSILEKVKTSALKVKNGEAIFERDSVIFDEIQYSYSLLSCLMWIAAQKHGRLNILDFGGSLGSTYYQNKFFLDSLESVNWCIVEQPDFVSAGLDYFADERLHFFHTVEECFRSYQIDAVLLSGVLQYLEEPYSLIDRFITTNVKYLIIDRTPFVKGKDRITIQKVNPKIYKGSYPCWFFNKTRFLSQFECHYQKLLEFDALDRANIRSEFKGILFRKITHAG